MVNIGVLARILAGQFGLQVIFQDNFDTFAIAKDANGKSVLVISSSLAGVKEEQVPEINAMLRGALAHECVGHLRFTNMEIPRSSGALGSIENMLEDLRIETMAPTIYPGAKRALLEMVSELESDKHGFWKPNLSGPPEGTVLLWMLRKCRAELLGQPMRQEWTDAAQNASYGHFGKTLCEQGLALARQAVQMPDTRSIHGLAKQILDLFVSEQGQESSGDDTQGGAAARFDANAQVSDLSPEDYVKKVVGGIGGGLDYRQVTIAEMQDRSTGDSGVRGPVVNAVAHRLRSSMRQNLIAIVEDEDDAPSDRGRLHVGFIPQVLAGDCRTPFLEDGDIAPGLDTALHLLVDASGSMSKVAEFAKMTMLAVGDACAEFEAQGLDVSLWTFNGGITLLRSHRQRWAEARGRAFLRYQPGGGTQWPACSMHAVSSLATSRRKRKVLLTITDGDLGNNYRNVIDTARHANIELEFVGIDVQSPDPTFSFETAYSKDPASIVRATGRALQKAMLPAFR